MKPLKNAGKIIAVLTFAGACASPVFAQTTAPDNTGAGAATSTATNTATERSGDNDRDYGWIGLLGLAGLQGLRRKPEETRTTNLSQQR